jgi:hypothetical protein
MAALEKKNASSPRMSGLAGARTTARSGRNHTASPITRTARLLRALTRVWAGPGPSSPMASGPPGASSSEGTNARGHRRPPIRPTAAAPATISGNGTRKTKMARNAAAATLARAQFRTAVRPIRMMAAATIPTTAAWRPEKIPDTTETSPCTAYT